MKWIWTLFLSSTCFGQLTMQSMQPFFKSGTSAHDNSPLGTPGVLWYWNSTNQLVGQFVTNWIDQVSSVAFKWNTTKAANTRPTNSLSGVYFDGFNFGQNLTNDNLVDISTSRLTNIWVYISLKPNHFNTGTPIYIWGDSGTAHGYLESAASAVTSFAAAGPGTVAMTTALAANTEYDISLCCSNGLIWSWTNGFPSVVAGSFVWASGNNFDPTGLAGQRSNANWYDGYIQEIAAGTNGFGGQYFTSVTASNLHWWRTNVVIYSTP